MIQKKIESLRDHLMLGVTTLQPQGEIKGIVQLVHGMAEHRLRYMEFMEFLSDAGYVCVIHDHRGHGESVACEDDYGYFGEDGAEKIVEDVHQITNYIKELYPDLPLYLFGHSMGSLIVRAYCAKYDYELHGLIVCGSPSENKAAGIGKLATKLIAIFHNDHYRSNFIHNLAFGSYNKNFKDAKSENAWICADENVVRIYDEDPLCGFQFTLNGFEQLFTLMQKAYAKDGWIMRNPTLPILFISGSDDPCAGSRHKFEQAMKRMEQVGYKMVSGNMYPGKRHEILNEDNRQVVYHDVLEWLNGNL